jgi:general stress protein 26
MNTKSADLKKVWDLIKHLEVAMLTTQDSDGTLHSRPMAALEMDPTGYLWFFTEASSHKVDEVQHHRNVNVAYLDPAKNRFVSISGKAQVIRDAAKAKELWRPFLRAWFSKGVDDPSVALLRIQIERADYWDSPASRVVQLLSALDSITKSAVNQQDPQPAHGSIRLSDQH